jgi:site-specific DNA-methyltransferase (adenine-specific)
MEAKIIHGDCLEVMRAMEPNSVDLVFGSPPYEDARTYGIDFRLKGQAWVDWMVEVFRESLRICNGLVAMVVEGRTRQFRYSATPVLLMADLHRAGICLRKPPAFHRVGVTGSGGPDWLRNDYEFIICATNGGKLPWSENIAMGRLCKFPTGGAMSNRNADGRRKNARTHVVAMKQKQKMAGYTKPDIANPGNVLKFNVGGGVMGDKICHENEAPFPEKLAEFFIRSFCPPGGTVLDPFSGSGTTSKVAVVCGRNGIGIDVRESQVELSKRRTAKVQTRLL